MANYNNARDSQMFGGYDGVGSYAAPLPPCKNAYSIGPSASDDTVLTVVWLSSGYNFGGSVPMSECGLIKDSNDVFYYVAWYSSGGIHLVVNEYDAENDIRTDYEITVPAGLGDILLDSSQIFIRKKSSTQLDIVFFGSPDGDFDEFILQHYLWTIGAATMTLVVENQYSDVGGNLVGNTIARVLQGPLVVNIHYIDQSVPPFTNMISMATYHLDTQVFSTQSLFEPDDITRLISWDFSFYHCGYASYIVWVYGYHPSEFWNCGGIVPVTFSRDAEGKYGGVAFLLDGSYSSFDGTFDNRSGRHASVRLIKLSDDYSANPDTGEAYARLQWNARESDDLNCAEAFSPPDTQVDLFHYIKISTAGSMTLLGPGSCPECESGWAGSRGIYESHKYSYSSRNDPISLLASGEHDYLLHWITQSLTAEDVFTTISSTPPCGSGQRNDNQPELFALRDGSNNVWYTDSGAVYLTQTTTFGGDAANVLPVTGMYGKYPVRHKSGRWAIFGPFTPITAGAAWYVV